MPLLLYYEDLTRWLEAGKESRNTAVVRRRVIALEKAEIILEFEVVNNLQKLYRLHLAGMGSSKPNYR